MSLNFNELSLKLENSMSDSSCWSMLQSYFANNKATEEFSTLVSPFKILLNPKILSTF